MVDIRLARPEDAAAIARVHVAVWQTTYRGLIADALIDEVTFAQRAAMWGDILTAYTETHPVLVAEDFGVGVVRLRQCRARCAAKTCSAIAASSRRFICCPPISGAASAARCCPASRCCCASAATIRRIAWVLASNPACGFYEAMGGVLCAQRVAEDEDEGDSPADLAYGWSDLAALAKADARQ